MMRQIMSRSGLISALLAKVGLWAGRGTPMQRYPVYILSDPDLLNNRGLSNAQNAGVAIAMIRTLRAEEPRGERIPALALTAFARADDRKRSLLAGYQAHLAKPFDVGELILIIANLTGS